MLFLKDEKVFSLRKTAAAVPRTDITALFEEFYCYLLVAGLFREGESQTGVHMSVTSIADQNFYLPSGAYRSGLATIISKGLRDRFLALTKHQNISSGETDLLQRLNALFTGDMSWVHRLTGRDLFSVAVTRAFSEDMTVVARYVAAAFGQSDFLDRTTVPRLYLSAFGNIHLARRDPALAAGPSGDLVVLEEPVLKYGSTISDGTKVTALWAIVSAQVSSLTTLCETPYPGDNLGDMLSSLGFLTESGRFEDAVPMPTFASSLYMKKLMGVDGMNPIATSVSFYQNFLYGSTASKLISRQSILGYILNLMMGKMGETHLSHLFSPNSYYRNLATRTRLSSTTPKRPALFQMALETLDAKDPDDEDVSIDDVDAPEDDSLQDPNSDSDGYEPSTPPTASLLEAPAQDKDTIGLISFNKTGEGVDEDLYRQAVVSLNSKLRSDDSIPVTADVRDALDHWVNGWLYRTAIAETRKQIDVLKLQQYLKPVSTKG